jgi:hypothetical protein
MAVLRPLHGEIRRQRRFPCAPFFPAEQDEHDCFLG